jgi:hypothetical protein
MPETIEHIDAISRKKQRDVLSIRFHARDTDSLEYDYQRDPVRQRIISWLDERGIAWQPCGPVANENGMWPYCGSLYVDVPYNTSDPTYELLRAYLENPDGTMRHPTVTFQYYPLELAMKNAHHDSPGFWERWAEDF